MARPNYAYAKRQKEIAKKQKKEAKRLRKLEKKAELDLINAPAIPLDPAAAPAPTPTEPTSTEQAPAD